jgi:hypothetical protein
MRIHNLNTEQVKMLEKLWTFSTLEDIDKFKSGLPLLRRQQIETLLALVMLTALDNKVDELPVYNNVDSFFKNILKVT